jgi:hypothetical protein
VIRLNVPVVWDDAYAKAITKPLAGKTSLAGGQSRKVVFAAPFQLRTDAPSERVRPPEALESVPFPATTLAIRFIEDPHDRWGRTREEASSMQAECLGGPRPLRHLLRESERVNDSPEPETPPEGMEASAAKD